MKTENVESDFTRLTAFLVKSNLKFVIKEEPCGYLHLNSEKSIILAADSSNSSPKEEELSDEELAEMNDDKICEFIADGLPEECENFNSKTGGCRKNVPTETYIARLPLKAIDWCGESEIRLQPIIAYSFDSTGKLRCIKSEIILCDEYIHGFDIYPEKGEIS